ncbi:hypothetical protein [Actinotignum urinale]|uniref:hypothetical protein n=1 Tax=Actinotignum urinale TaxID=190146 RepID=UPI0003B6940A|nr:hypothetical protein [Actinotignum urinale]MDY5159675.1 hypothetical protein [Actinotignum urinale]
MDKSYFGFVNNQCKVEKEEVLDRTHGEICPRLLIKKLPEETVRMSYVVGEGLRCENNTTSKNNILGEFLGLTNGSFSDLKIFMEKYGFLFPLPNEDDYVVVEHQQIFLIARRLQALMILLNYQDLDGVAEDSDVSICSKLLNAIIDIAFLTTFSLRITDREVVEPYAYPILRTIEGFASFHEITSTRTIEINGLHTPVFEIADHVVDEGNSTIPYETYNKWIDSDQRSNWAKNVMRIFVSNYKLQQNHNDQLFIDLLFHLTLDLHVNDPDEFESYDDLESVLEDWISQEDTKLRVKTIKNLSRYFIKTELDHALEGIRAEYNETKLAPDWKLPSLYSAIYFSLFYMDSREVMYRKCANPYCQQFFEVYKTNSRKKYCCTACSNATTQRRYKKRARINK